MPWIFSVTMALFAVIAALPTSSKTTRTIALVGFIWCLVVLMLHRVIESP